MSQSFVCYECLKAFQKEYGLSVHGRRTGHTVKAPAAKDASDPVSTVHVVDGALDSAKAAIHAQINTLNRELEIINEQISHLQELQERRTNVALLRDRLENVLREFHFYDDQEKTATTGQ